MTDTKTKLPAGVLGSVDEVAAAIGVHRRTIQEWKHKPDFPEWSNGHYNVIKIERWRHGYRFIEDDNASALLDDMDHRTSALIQSLIDIQPGLVQGISEDQQATFAALLDETIENAIKEAFSDGPSEYLCVTYDESKPQ